MEWQAYERPEGGQPTWCPGCGDYGILWALKNAMAELDYPQHEFVVVSGIGCSGNLPYWINTYGFHGIHGRALPLATGLKLANHGLNVIVVGGDGDGYSIGMGHFIHAARRNINLTYIVHNNGVYGLTTGQTSPVSFKGFKSKSTPTGVIDQQIYPLAMALSAGATFISRSYAGDFHHLKDTMKEAIQHKGFALVDTLQPCVTFNPKHSYEYYMPRVYKLNETGYDPQNKEAAFAKSYEWGEKIPIGVFYREDRSTYEEEVATIKEMPLVRHDIYNVDINKTLQEYY